MQILLNIHLVLSIVLGINGVIRKLKLIRRAKSYLDETLMKRVWSLKTSLVAKPCGLDSR